MNFSDRYLASLPRGTVDLVKTAAQRKFTKPSEYVRQAILARLEQDGLCPMPDSPKKAA
jgi:hypothetical protein